MDVNETHNDIIALGIIILLDVFVGNYIKLDRPVSRVFHETYRRITGKAVLPVDDFLPQRRAHDNARPALAYSGGVDSTAALAIMPKNTAAVFVDRIQKKGELYNKSAAYESCESVRRIGNEVYQIKSDMEHIIRPHTFSHPLAPGVAAIILADYLKFDSIAFGNILENIYGLTSNRFTEHSASVYFDKLFKSAGIFPTHVTAGLTEVSTARITEYSKYRGIGQSCMYGEGLGKVCNSCLKCFRRLLLDDINEKEAIDNKLINQTLLSNEASRAFRKIPLTMQSTYMYLTARTRTKHAGINLLARKTGANIRNTEWVTYWYSPSEVFLPKQYKKEIVSNILKYVQPMSDKHIKRVKRWNLRKQKYSLIRQYWHGKFWQYYSERFDMHILSCNIAEIEMKKGEVYNEGIKIYKHLPWWRKQNITRSVRWGSSDGAIAYYKDGEVRAKKTGEALLYARYGKSRISLKVKVLSE